MLRPKLCFDADDAETLGDAEPESTHEGKPTTDQDVLTQENKLLLDLRLGVCMLQQHHLIQTSQEGLLGSQERRVRKCCTNYNVLNNTLAALTIQQVSTGQLLCTNMHWVPSNQ